MINLKSIERESSGFPKRFAMLVSPNVPLHSDEELYAAVRTQGYAVIAPEDTFGAIGAPETVKAEDFCATWQGD